MDDSFQLRARQMLERGNPAPLEHDVLSAALAIQQAASPTACAQSRAREQVADGKGAEPLTELLLAGPDWQHAASAQSGCFNRVEAGRRLTPGKAYSP